MSSCSRPIDEVVDADGNVLLDTQAMLCGAQGNIIRLPKGRMALVSGLKDFVVVEEDGVLMICPKHDVATMRRFRNELKMKPLS